MTELQHEATREELIVRLSLLELAVENYLTYVIDKYHLKNLPDDFYCDEMKHLYNIIRASRS